ncbi:MAG: hypothetical protein KDI03_15075 [Anaerolineae bacterium]|nr:hypothetical protein [Anaerolineae bacterium]MCB0256967.1 hypothetical protein [Anaerolineae bacterium]
MVTSGDYIRLRAERLIPAVLNLRQRGLDLEASFAARLAAIDPTYQPSARNLLHYLALRQVGIVLEPAERDIAARRMLRRSLPLTFYKFLDLAR